MLRFRSALIVTYGRSGSTLLQGVLNSIEGALVRGENGNFVYHLFQAYKALRFAETRGRGSNLPTHPWYGAHRIDPERFLETVHREVRHLLVDEGPEPHLLGFKEIRYPWCLDDFHEYLDFLGRLFPEPCFLFLTRDHAEVERSSWWYLEDPVEVRALLSDTEQIFGEAMERRPERCFRLDYRDLAANGAKLAELFAFLGAPYDRARVAEVLSTPHSYPTTIKARSQMAKIKAEGRTTGSALPRRNPKPQ